MRVEVGIDDPVLGNRETLVEALLHALVGAAGAWRPDFHHQIRCADHVLRREHFVLPRPADVEHIGLDHVDPGEQHVERCNEDASGLGLAQMRLHQVSQVQDNRLVLAIRGRRHVELSVDELAAHAVVRHAHEVVVGELRARIGPDRSEPDTRLILAPGSAVVVPAPVAGSCPDFRTDPPPSARELRGPCAVRAAVFGRGIINGRFPVVSIGVFACQAIPSGTPSSIRRVPPTPSAARSSRASSRN